MELAVSEVEEWPTFPSACLPTCVLLECSDASIGRVIKPVVWSVVAVGSEVLLVRHHQLGHVINHHKLLLVVGVVRRPIVVLVVQVLKL